MRSIACLIGLLLASSCVNGITGNTNGGPDASSRSGTDATRSIDGAISTSDAGPFTCRNTVTSGNTAGHHNPGMDCMDGCHNHGFTLAGTLYTSAAGTMIVSGATISVFDVTGKDVEIVAQTNGNFYTTEAVTYPLTAYASACPTIQTMTATIAKTSDTGCNQTACHNSGASPGRIHLP